MNRRFHGGYPRLPYQYGYGMSMYQGMPYQYGEGFGNILRSAFRFLMPILAPIVTRSASKFITSAADGLTHGKSLKDAATSSLRTAASEALDAGGEVIKQKLQNGSGRKRRKTRRARKSKKAKFPFPQSGAGKARRRKRSRKQTGGRKRKVRRRVYKSRARMPKEFRFLKSNF